MLQVAWVESCDGKEFANNVGRLLDDGFKAIGPYTCNIVRAGSVLDPSGKSMPECHYSMMLLRDAAPEVDAHRNN